MLQWDVYLYGETEAAGPSTEGLNKLISSEQEKWQLEAFLFTFTNFLLLAPKLDWYWFSYFFFLGAALVIALNNR